MLVFICDSLHSNLPRALSIILFSFEPYTALCLQIWSLIISICFSLWRFHHLSYSSSFLLLCRSLYVGITSTCILFPSYFSSPLLSQFIPCHVQFCLLFSFLCLPIKMLPYLCIAAFILCSCFRLCIKSNFACWKILQFGPLYSHLMFLCINIWWKNF